MNEHAPAWLTLDDAVLENCSGDASAFMNEAFCVTATRSKRRTSTSRALQGDCRSVCLPAGRDSPAIGSVVLSHLCPPRSGCVRALFGRILQRVYRTRAEGLIAQAMVWVVLRACGLVCMFVMVGLRTYGAVGWADSAPGQMWSRFGDSVPPCAPTPDLPASPSQ